MSAWYLDSSAIVKLVVRERESAALTAWRADLDPEDVVMTCELAVAEVVRAVIRTLDAIHLAAALAAGEDLGGIVTYDARMADAARAGGLLVLAPGDRGR